MRIRLSKDEYTVTAMFDDTLGGSPTSVLEIQTVGSDGLLFGLLGPDVLLDIPDVLLDIPEVEIMLLDPKPPESVFVAADGEEYDMSLRNYTVEAG